MARIEGGAEFPHVQEPTMSLQEVVDAADAIVRHEIPAKATSFGNLVLTAQAIFFISLGLVATMAWIAFLGWLAYRIVVVLP